ncbi:MAG: ATP-binding cassette domain-containing protein [Gammaproteobacteria bacterium]|nr:ATP-binding cassette domain-containing protein [Gammaproteobacteria bacterium]
MPDPIISAHALTKHYGDYVAVDNIDFNISPGRCFGFLGPNGAGKTTTLQIILGLAQLSSGELKVFDLPIPEKAREIRARIGVVPQADNLDPDFTIAENLSIYASYFRLAQDQALTDRIDHLLEFASLSERRNAKTETLSGGMKRRLTIARALINDPELVILDEPTTGLDPQARHVIWGRLNELRDKGTTLLLTTHYMEEAERLCDELVIMDKGKILDQGSPTELIKRHVEPEVIELRGVDEATLNTIRARVCDCRIENLGNSVYCYTHDAAAQLNYFHNEHQLTFMHRPAGLEDVFLKLTGRELRD